MVNKYERYHAAQSWFAKNREIHKNSRHRALEIIAAKISEVMEVERVGIWFYTIDKDAIYEEMTLQVNKEKTQGHLILKSDLPKYFTSISEERVIASNNTLADESMTELKDIYMKPLNVHALLDAPVFSDGEMLGILCCEQIGKTREWDIHDKNFATAAADFIGRIIEAEKRHTYEKELRHRINYLENDLRRKLDDLHEAKLSLDLALESAQVGKWEWNIETNSLSLNRTWYTKLGYEFNELPQDLDTFVCTLHPEDRKRVFSELDDHIQGRNPIFECRYRMLTKAGDIQWCLDRGAIISRNENGQPIRMIGVNVNVTPMVKWEQSLTISEQQLKAMIQSLPTSVAMFDRSFKYIAYSSKWKEDWYPFFRPDDEGKLTTYINKDEWLEIMKLALQGITTSKDEDLIEVGPGINYWTRWVIQPWKNSNQEIGGVIVMAENITARKETEMRLAQTSKLSALGEMAGGIAHEINNPLSIIKGYIDLLRRHSVRKSLSPELLKQYIEKMDTTVERISKIVSGMRRFSRESSLDEKTNYNLNKIVEETLDICQERINNNGTVVDVQYLNHDPIIHCRPVEISQVLLNLINNSYQATSDYTHPWIKIKIEEAGENFRISVVDSGEGIPQTVRQKLFQPFFTTKEVGSGTGLGLSISRGIVEDHHGKLYYQEDSPNTTFVIELPKARKEDTQSVH
jgi:signal transduction histidine kinase/PAS domain-containing protein